MTNEPAPDRPRRAAPRDPRFLPVPTQASLQPAPSTRPTPPVPGAPDSEWQVCEVDLPAVLDALTPLCKQLKLRDRSSRGQVHWHLELLHLELWIDVTAVADGERTLVGVQIRPVRGTFASPPQDPDPRGQIGSVMFMLSAPLFVASGELWMAALMLSPMLLWLILRNPLERAWRTKKAWASDWRRDFWIALHGRVAPRALYR